MAKGIKKISRIEKQHISDLSVSSIATVDRGAGDGCRVMLIKRDPLLAAIDRAFADHWLGVDHAFAESVLDGTGGAGFDRRAVKLRKKLEARLRAVRRGADLRPGDPAVDRPSLSAGADPTDVESDGAFADRDGARRFRQNASPGMATSEGDDFGLGALPVGRDVGPARPDGAAALRAHAEGSELPTARRGDGRGGVQQVDHRHSRGRAISKDPGKARSLNEASCR